MAKTITQVRREIILAFADCGMNATKVARRLYMDRGNVHYHLKVIKSITGLDPRNSDDLGKLVEMLNEMQEISFEEMTTKDLIDFCMEKFCCIEVCNALGCNELCKEQDCPLYVLLNRIREREG